jgi:uncharacterized membrane protein
MTADAAHSKPRLAWIDILRGVAVIGMIQTHVLNAFLHPSYGSHSWHDEWRFLSGLVAPAFLWIAGYMQGRSIRKAHRDNLPVFNLPRLKRLGVIALIAYGLHVPWIPWFSGDFGQDSWRVFLQSDILHCMAVSLTALLLLGLVPSKWFDWCVSIFIVLAIFCTPAAQSWQTGTLFLDAFLNHETGSLFPLFPWFGFCALGCLASRWEVSWKVYLPVSLALVVIGISLSPDGYVQPSFFFLRLGWLGLFIVVISLMSPRFAPRWLQLAGRESLLIYVVHLLLIYSVPIAGVSLDRWIGRTQSLSASGLIFLAVSGISMALAALNERRKRERLL